MTINHNYKHFFVLYIYLIKSGVYAYSGNGNIYYTERILQVLFRGCAKLMREVDENANTPYELLICRRLPLIQH